MFDTSLVPRLNELGFPTIPKSNDKAEQLLQDLWTVGSCWNSPGPWWGGYNPEKFLNRWGAILSARDDLAFDVIGWAFFAAKREAESERQKELLPYDFLTGQKPRALLLQLAGWAEARLRYHRVCLQLTFYKRDGLALQEPIASNVGWLRQRLKHFVAVRTKEIQVEPHRNPKHYYSSSELDYLGWLHLVCPISEQWTLHEISKAVRKTFFFEDRFQFREKWLAKPPAPLTYRVPEKNDSPGARFKKMTVPVGFEEAEADWLSGTLSNLRPFSDSLADWMKNTGFSYKTRYGRPPKSRAETPSEPRKSTFCSTRYHPESAIEAFEQVTPDLATVLKSPDPLENFEMLGKKDLEKDDPKGWLLAKTLTV